MILTLLISAAAICGLLGVFGFIQFVRYRVKENEEKESFYKSLHFISLAVLFVLGIVIMFFLSGE